MNHVFEPDPVTGQPVGVAVDAAPAPRPQPVTLAGRYGRIERLAQHHDVALWKAVAGHDEIWPYMPYGPFADQAAFSTWIATRLTLEDPYSYAIVDPSGRAVGIATLMEIRPAVRVIEVGNILYSPALMRTRLGTEAQYLLRATPSRRSATAVTSGNATRSSRRHAAPRCATASYSRASSVST